MQLDANLDRLACRKAEDFCMSFGGGKTAQCLARAAFRLYAIEISNDEQSLNRLNQWLLPSHYLKYGIDVISMEAKNSPWFLLLREAYEQTRTEQIVGK